MAKNNSSILQLLRRYLSGDVGPRQEAELERHAQSDEFLAEAMEGLRSQPEANHEAAVTRMRRNLPKSKQVVRPIGWYRFAAAASILLLIGTALFILPRWMDGQLETTAMKEAQPESIESPVTVEEADSEDTSEPRAEVVPQEPIPQVAKPVQIEGTGPSSSPKENVAPPAVAPKPAIASYTPVTAATEAIATPAPTAKKTNRAQSVPYSVPVQADAVPSAYGAEEADEIVEELSEAEPLSVAPPPMIGQRFDNASTLPNGFRKISGYVTDENDRPITDANIALPGQPLGEKTNIEGFFELIADNTVRQINVMHPDYQRAEVNLPSGEKEVQINLENNREESEAKDDWRFNGAISTYYPNRTSSSAALKEGTTRELRNAVLTSKPANLGSGKVRVSFSVQPDGSLSSFNLTGRSTDALQAYVKRYLLENSEWELIRGNESARVYLVFNFK